jgi:acyl dehydratase
VIELTYEDFTPGRCFDMGTTVVDGDEMVAFARRFDPQPFHVGDDAGAASIFGGLAASGWFTAGLWMRASGAAAGIPAPGRRAGLPQHVHGDVRDARRGIGAR